MSTLATAVGAALGSMIGTSTASKAVTAAVGAAVGASFVGESAERIVSNRARKLTHKAEQKLLSGMPQCPKGKRLVAGVCRRKRSR